MAKKVAGKFRYLEAVVWAPNGWVGSSYVGHPLNYGELVYYLGEIPNVPGHCVVIKHGGQTVAMIHPGDLREATEDEL